MPEIKMLRKTYPKKNKKEKDNVVWVKIPKTDNDVISDKIITVGSDYIAPYFVEHDYVFKNEDVLPRSVDIDFEMRRHDDEEKIEHRKTREFISEKLDILSNEVAKKDDIIRTKDEIIETIQKEAKETQRILSEQIVGLQGHINRFLPHKRLLKTSLFLLSFCSISIFSDELLGVVILNRFWAVLGLLTSSIFSIMALIMFKDFKKQNSK